MLLLCRAIAAESSRKDVQRTMLGVVQPGDTIPVPYGWQRAGVLPLLPTHTCHGTLAVWRLPAAAQYNSTICINNCMTPSHKTLVGRPYNFQELASTINARMF